MIEVGQQKKAKYWGKFEVKKVAKLKKSVECECQDVGIALFDPTLVKIKWENPPSDDNHEFWFPYWITINGMQKYGQFAPMIGERALLELLQDAIRQDFFSNEFLLELKDTIISNIK
jgi:hypothetical protein